MRRGPSGRPASRSQAGVNVHSPALEALHKGNAKPGEVFAGTGRLRLGEEGQLHEVTGLTSKTDALRKALLASIDRVREAQGGGNYFPERDEK
jgi:hypothetical protein